MSARPWIAYVGPVAFPEGGAAARRILGNAQALVAAGYDVTVVSGQMPEQADKTRADIAPGIDCVSVGERNAEHLPRPVRLARYAMMGAKTRRWLAARPTRPAAVILYSGYAPYLLQLTGWARRASVALLFDAVEWYEAPGRLGLVGSPYHWNVELAMRVLIPRLDGVIAISSELERYYRARDMAVLRVPPLLDCKALPVPDTSPSEGPLRLAYSGDPGSNKDLLDAVLVATASGRAAGRIRLEIAGPSEADLARLLAGAPADNIVAHGRVTHARSLEIVAGADFTVLLRRPSQVATHGFPTKFVESLALGTPVIANLTSDLGDHLHDGETGLVANGPEAADLAARIEEAAALDPAARAQMRRRARAQAEQSFDYRAYAEMFGTFVCGVARKDSMNHKRDHS